MLTPQEKDALQRKIEVILNSADLYGFTELLFGDELKRYVVAFTDNHVWSVELLVEQAIVAKRQFEIVTLGGRMSLAEHVVVDIGTSTDDLAQAIWMGKAYRQKYIFDRKENCDIPLG